MVEFKELAKLPLFTGLSEEILSSISRILREERFKAGSLVIREGDPADFFYIIHSGEMEVRKTIDSESQKHKTLAILEEGDIFGEMALFGEELRAADVLAIQDSQLWRVDFKDFSKLLEVDPRLGIQLLKAIANILIFRLKAINQELATLYEVSQIISSTRNIGELLRKAFDQVMRDVRSAEAGFIAVWNRYNEEFDICCSSNLPDNKHLSIEDPLILELQAKRTPLMVRDISQNPALEKGLYKGSSMLISPILYKDELLGLIGLIHPSKKRAFGYSQMVLLSSVCTNLASALKNIEKEDEDLLKERLAQKKVYY